MDRTRVLARMCARRQVELSEAPRVPSESDKVDNRNAVRMCVLIAMLNSAMYDLEGALTDAGLWRRDVKHHITRAHEEVNNAHRALSKIMGSSMTKASKQYNALMDLCLEDVNNAILIEDALDKQFNICLSLCRLVGTYNNKLRSRYKFIPAERITKLCSNFESVPLRDEHIDFIVDANIKIKYENAN